VADAVEVVVELGGEEVIAGRLYSHRRSGQESATFVYATDYLAHAEAYEIDPSLPLVTGQQHTPARLEMFRAFGDTAPDRWGRTIIDRRERQRAEEAGETPSTHGEIDYLLGVRDDLRQGALRFRDPGSEAFLATEVHGVPMLTDLPKLLTAAERIEENNETAEDLRILFEVGSSLGGSRPKAHLLDKDGSISIAKFPSSTQDSWNVMAWEKVALDLAHEAGIRVTESRLLSVADRNILIVRRFDREGTKRIGYASAITMLETADHEEHSYLEIAEVIETRSPRASDDLVELWRRIAFNILISNTDDHLRNHAFLHTQANQWRLSPAFDLNPNPKRIGYLRTSVDGGDREASVERLLRVSPYFRLKDDEARETLAAVVAAVLQWRKLAASHGLKREAIREIEPAFEHEQLAKARSLTGI
jgi:serine/threonine-protein kinase HipA